MMADFSLRFLTCLLIFSQTCSIRLRSGVLADHAIACIPIWRYRETENAACGRALPCKSKTCSPIKPKGCKNLCYVLLSSQSTVCNKNQLGFDVTTSYYPGVQKVSITQLGSRIRGNYSLRISSTLNINIRFSVLKTAVATELLIRSKKFWCQFVRKKQSN